ncbi:MAG: 3-deoxy-7-phosphoheptulonate synthase [Proteobacteria bacterium]|jgi:3-deoxy-7-phosphoheptulonate synthase|nr:3-deoxy-7-phosphoheptulonate synthase [Pseudomonadota bacterium]
MSYKIIKKLPTGAEIIQQIPLSKSGYDNINRHRHEIRNILSGHDSRLLIIVGPCSAWPYEAVLEYADKLIALNDKVKNKLKLVMRSYIQKPRTVKGWMGPANQPDPLAAPDIERGMHYARGLMVKLVEKNLAIADEALFTHNSQGFLELLSWVAIGARSSEDQEHRIFASSVDCPVGIKNPTSGSIRVGVNGIIAAQGTHVAAFDGYEVETSGNDFAHLVLRGGSGKPNYSKEHLEEVLHYLEISKVKNPAVITDVSHDNCLINGVKDYQKQGDIILEVLSIIKENPDLATIMKGFMLESFIKEGRQNVRADGLLDMGGLSITDACLGWGKTEELLLQIAQIHSV